MNTRTPLLVLLTGVVIVLIGLALAGLGTWLVLLGGSPYYLLAGLGLLVCGVLLGLRRYVGAWVYTAVLVATAVWAVWEVGLDGWSLIPRLIALAVLGIWIWSPWVAGHLGTQRSPPALAMGKYRIFLGRDHVCRRHRLPHQ